MVQNITIQEALQKKDAVFFDTRTPQEFADDHIVGALNVPLLSNEQRAIVGTTYVQVSREQAVEQGILFFSQNLPAMMKHYAHYRAKELILYCWRGGMRSRIIASFLDALGYRVFQLVGGYKSYRAYVREALNKFLLKAKVVVLYGLTGVGKTELLQHVPYFIDLEELAQHRGSQFGGIGLKPRSQKHFENLLLHELERLRTAPYLVVEGESKRIGDVHIPLFLYNAMLSGEKILVQRSFEGRVKHSVSRYLATDEQRHAFREILFTLRKLLSTEHKQQIVAAIDDGDSTQTITLILQHYYDSLYAHGLQKLQYACMICTDDFEKAVLELRAYLSKLKN